MNKLIQDAQYQCARDLGYDVQVSQYNTMSGMATIKPGDLGFATEEQARTQGLAVGIPASITVPPEPPRAQSDAMQACREQVEGKLSDATVATLASAEQLLLDAYNFDAGSHFEAYAAQGELELHCLVDKGWEPVLSLDLQGLAPGESPSLFEIFGIAEGKVVTSEKAEGTEKTYMPSTEEIDLAIDRVACRAELGSYEFVVGKIAAIQQQWLDSHEIVVMQTRTDLQEALRDTQSKLG